MKAYPTFVVLDVNEKVLLKKEGGNFDGLSFVQEIERGINPEMSPSRLAERYASGERTPELIEGYAFLKMKEARQGRQMNRQKVEEAIQMVTDYFQGLTEEQKLAAPNVFMYSSTYTNSVTDPKAVFMIAHQNKFAPEIREEVAKYISSLYQTELRNLMNGSKAYDETVYLQLKKQMIDAGMNKEGKWDIPFRLIETHATNDWDAYLTACESDFKKMPEDLQASLFSYFHQVMQTEDKDILKRAVRFMRNQLPELHTSTIYFGITSLMQLEKMAGLSDK